MRGMGSFVVLPDGTEAKSSRGPVSHNVIVRRKPEEGGFDGVSGNNSGEAWGAVNFRQPGVAPADPTIPWHYVVRQRVNESENGSWDLYAGIQVHFVGGLENHEANICYFPRHRSSGMWGSPAPATHFYLFFGEQWNSKEFGCRVDEYCSRSLQLAGLPVNNEFQRRSFYRVLDCMTKFMEGTLMMDERAVRAAVAEISATMQLEIEGVIDRAPLIDNQGRDAGEYIERMDGTTEGMGFQTKEGQ